MSTLEVSLIDLAADHDQPGVFEFQATDAVVLATTDDAFVEVWMAGVVHHLPTATRVSVVTEVSRRQEVILGALAGINQQRLQVIHQLDQAAREHTDMLDRIRTYAITKHREGVYSQRRLNEFLDAAGLPRFESAR